MSQAYQVLRGLNYPSMHAPDGERRAEIGDVVDDLPASSIGWLLADRCIVATDAPITPLAAPEPEAPVVPEAPVAPEAAPEG